MTAEFGVGQHMGDYEIISILGVGGMGKVYKVRNVIADRFEAMKVLLPDLHSNQSLADRFLREIRLLATLSHPNIAALRTAMTYEDQLVMIMEFVEGETLANRLARAPLSTAETLRYAEQVLSALRYAHKQNIVHRDIKPANMMLTPQGVVKLMDFGIARSGTDGSLTTTGTTLGSLNYMPPEQVRGEAADARSDIYSFGVSLYEMLTGKLPFQGDSQYALMTAHLNQTPAAPITLRSDLPPGLNEIIMIAMAKDPGSRFQSADAFRTALSSVPVSELPKAGTTATAASRPSTGKTTIVDMPLPPRVPTEPPAARAPAPMAGAATGGAAPAPTMPMSLPGTPAAPASPSVTRSSANRGVWLALGALLGAGVLIAAGMYVPRHFGTHADPNKSAFPPKNESENAATAPAPTTAAASAPTSTSTPTNGSAPIVSLQGLGGSVKVDDKGNVAIDSPSGGMHIDAATGSVTMAGKGASLAVNAGKKDLAKRNPAPARAEQAENPASAAPAGPSAEEIAKVQEEADKLNIRASAVSHSLDTLRQQQTASGYNLRGDIAASQERMQLYLAKADAALKAGDVKGAQKYFDLAEAECTKLERFLGH